MGSNDESAFKLRITTMVGIFVLVGGVITAHFSGIAEANKYAENGIQNVRTEAALKFDATWKRFNEMNEAISDIQKDVSFIRGKMDKSQNK